jgi:hypothetical protein
MNKHEHAPVTEWNRQARLELAIVFLFHVLMPYLEKLGPDGTLTEAKLLELEADFKDKTRIAGRDFTLDHVWGMAWAAVVSQENAIKEQSTETPYSPAMFARLKRAWESMTAIKKNGQKA